MKLTDSDKNIIKESLRYALMKIRDCTDYPNYEYKQERLAEVKAVIKKVSEA